MTTEKCGDWNSYKFPTNYELNDPTIRLTNSELAEAIKETWKMMNEYVIKSDSSLLRAVQDHFRYLLQIQHKRAAREEIK